MTDQQYWEERKAYVKALYSLVNVLHANKIDADKLLEILQTRYGVKRLCQLTNEQMDELKAYLSPTKKLYD
ncbi:hypothetical protein [Gloeothece verrucosa]|uniref:Uncharacterized protein n=1 Tax=Gloeothece verrucosa (strain PCC 7822) TaxID=497965 RepID=E0UJ69_GLOV7|nr:hypothetical protein [Gloeothece verrucosa]ADN15772.1 hypothetical protein Cyan7822_3840 [Gloeothece verrucosa PCC 7822]